MTLPRIPAPRDIGIVPILGGRTMPSSSFVPHRQRFATFTVEIDMTNLMSLGVRWEAHLHTALIRRMEEAANKVIQEARLRLQPGHGYDTGLMYDSLVATLVSHFEQGMVAYDLEAPEAPYWVYVEFGHMTRAGNWWPGYYFLSGALRDNERYVMEKAQDALRDSIVALTAESRINVPGVPFI